MPDVLLAVVAEDTPVVGDEVGGVVEERLLLFCRGRAMVFDDGAGDNADVEFTGKRLVCFEVGGCFGGEGSPGRVGGGPAG